MTNHQDFSRWTSAICLLNDRSFFLFRFLTFFGKFWISPRFIGLGSQFFLFDGIPNLTFFLALAFLEENTWNNPPKPVIEKSLFLGFNTTPLNENNFNYEPVAFDLFRCRKKSLWSIFLISFCFFYFSGQISVALTTLNRIFIRMPKSFYWLSRRFQRYRRYGDPSRLNFPTLWGRRIFILGWSPIFRWLFQ